MARVRPISLRWLDLFGLCCALLLTACASGTEAASSHKPMSTFPTATPISRIDVPTEVWKQLRTPGRVIDLAMSPANPSTVFICVMLPDGAVAAYRSDNLGTSWQRLNIPNGSGSCVLSPDPINARQIYLALGVAGNMVLYQSADGGSHWSAPLASGTMFANGQIQFVDNGLEALVYAPTSDQPNLVRLERSTDGGRSWRPIDQPLLDQGVIVLSMIADPLSPATMLVLTQANPAQDYSAEALRGGLWRSSDAGKTWSEVSLNVPLNGELLAGADGQHIYAFDPGVPILQMSEDGGQDWLTLSLPAAAIAPGTGLLRTVQLAAGKDGILYMALNQSNGPTLYVYNPQSRVWRLMSGIPPFSGAGPIFFTDNILWLAGPANTLDRYVPGP